MRRATALLSCALVAAPHLAAQRLAYEGGLSLASGTYIFAERTTSWMLATGLAAGAGAVTVRMSLPLYLQNTTLISIGGPSGGMPTGGSSGGAVADTGASRQRGRGATDGQGVGMPALAASAGPVAVPTSASTGYSVAVGDPAGQIVWQPSLDPRMVVSASLTAKAPVADTATFGTGHWDFGAALALGRRISEHLLVGLDVAGWHLGDMEELDFQDPVYGTAGLTYVESPSWAAGLSITAGTSALKGYDEPVWIGAHFSRTTGTAWGVNGTVGLTETTPDVTLGLSWRVRLFSE